MQPRNDPVEWANRKKAAIERAKILREQNKIEKENVEAYSFKPKINKRPSFLKRQDSDSLDVLTNEVTKLSDDIFEKPLPGRNSAAAKQFEEFQNAMPPSPGSDALGKEMKKFPTDNALASTPAPVQQGSFKSKFMQQYDGSQKGSTKVETQSQPVVEDGFISSLRADSGKLPKNKPSWNSEVEAPKDFDSIKRASRRKAPVKPVESPLDDGFSEERLSVLPPSGRAQKIPARERIRQPEWNDDMAVVNTPSLPVDPFANAPASSPDMMHDMTQARSKLSLLKKKIRKSESGGSSRTTSNRLHSTLADGSGPSSDGLGYASFGHQSAPVAISRSRAFSMPEEETSGKSAFAKPSIAEKPMRRASPSSSQHQEDHPPQTQPPRQPAYQAAKPQYQLPPDAVLYEEPTEQRECPDCSRKFNPSAFEKHVKICAKVFLQKRKAFDSAKMRIQDNPELVQILRKTKKEERQSKKQAATPKSHDQTPIAVSNKAKWQAESNAFRNAMRAAREATKAIAEGKPLPPPMPSAPDPSLVPCPHCGRTFNAKAAERHIPQCQNIQAKPSMLKRGGGGGGGVNGAPAAKKKGR